MGFVEKLKEIFPRSQITRQGTDVIFVDLPSSIYIKELAIYTAISLIANAVSQSEIRCYENNKQTKTEDYYSLNIKPNPNESASQFWHKVVERMFRNPEGALCFISRRNLYCADDFSIREKRPFKGNLYDGIVIDEYSLNRTFSAKQCFLFRLEKTQARGLIEGAYRELNDVISTALQSYQNTNQVKYIFKVDSIQAGDERFNTEFENFLQEGIKKYTSGESKVYVQYRGRELTEADRKQSQKNSDDIVKLIDEIFSVTGKAFKIPDSLMTGNINNMEEVVNAFLTFAVDPVADEIGKTLTGAYGYESWASGRYYEVDTSKVGHVDVFKMAEKIDKLISSSFMSIDEVRERAGEDAINEDWSKKHLLTKNYQTIDEALKENGGGEKNGDEPQNDVSNYAPTGGQRRI